MTKYILDVLGGTISFESEFQIGLTFFVSLEVEYTISDLEKTEVSTHKKILIAEDDLENQELLKILLKRNNYCFAAFENGKLLLDHFTSGNNYMDYDIILMDLRMPVMNGFETVKAIREFEKEKNLKKIPIIAVTAHALKDELLKSLDAGCNAYITKPYEFKDLQLLISKYSKKN